MRRLISMGLIGMAMGVGCASTYASTAMRTKVVRTTTTWTCPAGTAADIHNPKPNCSLSKNEETGPRVALIDRVKFATGSAELSNESKQALDHVAGALKDDPAVIRITVVARTDNTGTEELNAGLAQERADAVKSYLQEEGLPGEKLETQALGEKAPVAPNDTEDGRALNRSASIVAMK